MIEDINFTRDDFAKSDWRKIIEKGSKRTCQQYSGLFSEAMQEYKATDNKPQYSIFFLLGAVCSLWLRPENQHQPFAPIRQGSDGSRSIDISDFAESHINLLKEIFDQIDDPELKSRIGDVVWTYQHKGNFQFAEMAIEAYLQSGESFFPSEDYYYGVERYTRAFHLAASLGRNSSKFTEVAFRINSLIDQSASSYAPFVSHLLELLYDYRQGDSNKNASIAESYAIVEQQKHEWHFARANWNRAARWRHLANQNDVELTCRLNEAECYVLESEDVLRSSQGRQYSVAAHHLQSAIELLRRLPDTEKRQKELHLRMLEIQSSTRDELGKISQEIDLTPHVEKAILAIKDKPFQEAVFTLCMLGSSPNTKNLRELIENMSKEHPLLSLISMNVIDERGRVVGRRDSILSGTPEEVEAAKIADMHQWARYEQDALAMVVNAARLQLLIDHTSGLRDFLELVINNPFVPPGREMIFARGYLAGFQGDFLEALHLLIPQVENSLRYMLNRQGIVTSSLSSEGIQEEYDLNVLLGMQELKQILGEDSLFDLQGILTSRFGFNFRNLMAHGLLEEQAFQSYSAVYVWWLLLRICCLPLIAMQSDVKEKDAESSE
jgi:hypothetical protein